MIFFDYCLIDFSISKELAPLADCLKKYQGVLVADEKAFNKVVEDLEEKYRAIPKAKERFLFHVCEGTFGAISVHRNNSTRKCIMRIFFTPIHGMFGFDSSQESIQSVPDDGDEYYSLPGGIKDEVKKIIELK
jgi:hypothetical protein